eukprot:4907658-Pleurochrysis_carterae.AAC.1
MKVPISLCAAFHSKFAVPRRKHVEGLGILRQLLARQLRISTNYFREDTEDRKRRKKQRKTRIQLRFKPAPRLAKPAEEAAIDEARQSTPRKQPEQKAE